MKTWWTHEMIPKKSAGNFNGHRGVPKTTQPRRGSRPGRLLWGCKVVLWVQGRPPFHDLHEVVLWTAKKNRPFQGPAMTGWWLSPALALWKIMEGYVTVGMTFHSQYDGKVIKNLWFQTTNQWLWTMINHHNPFHGFQSPPAERIPRCGGGTARRLRYLEGWSDPSSIRTTGRHGMVFCGKSKTS